MMLRVFISNTKIQNTETDIIFFPTNGIGEKLTAFDTSGNTVFVIDVHCVFTKNGRQLKLQDQGGVIIYRHLLQKFKHCQDKLKVVFYSPIPKEDLVKLNPENYVLKLLPFIVCKYEEGQFESELTQIISENKFPQFNNASENLLSGWALYKADKSRREKDFVETQFKHKTQSDKPKVITFIDDEINEWRESYAQIFEPGKNVRLEAYQKEKLPIGDFSKDKIDNLTNHVMQSALIVSDFYLQENHAPNTWLNKQQLEDKSGFKLFKAIKGSSNADGIHKGVPYVMYTSSNKIQYYQYLDAHGIDNWLVKDVRPNATALEKKDGYYTFKKVIEEFTHEESSQLYAILKKYWERIQNLEALIKTMDYTGDSNWWYSLSEQREDEKEEIPVKNSQQRCRKASSTNVDEVIDLLKDSWMAIRANMNRESVFAKSVGSMDKHYTAASVCSNLGKLFEFFKFSQGMKLNTYFKFLYCIRNIGSHYKQYKSIGLEDALIYFDCWLFALEKKEKTVHEAFKPVLNEEEFIFQGKTLSTNDTFVYALLYGYIQFINGFHLKENSMAHDLIKKRVAVMLADADKEIITTEIETDFFDETGNKIFVKQYRNSRATTPNANRIVSNWTSGGTNYGIVAEKNGGTYITNNA